MRLLKTAPVIFALAFASAAQAASVAEKKSMRSADEQAAAAAEQVKKACGNPALAFDINWDSFGPLDYEKNNVKKETALRWPGARAQNIADSLVEICKDADYKEEAQKLTQVRLTPHADGSRYHTFKKNGTVLEVGFGLFVSSAAENVTAEIKKVF